MAIDKNSKAYQNLLNSGYTDEQITQMHNDVAWGQTTQQTVANTTPVNTPNYENQGSGNYVYNEATGYYENQNAPRPTQTDQPVPEVEQETVVKQEETVGNTVPEIKQEWALKPLSQDYYNQTSQEALDKIVANLNWYRQTNPEFFTDYESFKKNFSYDSRNEEQKRALDTWYGWYQKGMELAGVPTTDLYTQYKDWQVSAAELENLRINNPAKYAELQSQINKWNIVAAYDDDKWQDGTGLSLQDMAYQMAMQTFNQFMSWDSSSWASEIFREYEDKMNNPDMLGLSDKCTEVQEEMENIQSDLDSIKKQVEAEYAGTWASRSKINAIISDRSYDLQLQLRTLNSEYNKYATQYNNRMQQYQTEFSMQLQEYQINQQERNQQMQELGFALDLMNFETNDQKAEREWNYWVKQQEYANWNINSKDYQTRYKAALNSVQNLLAQYPNIPMQRSAEQMADDILKAIDGGSDLGTELTKINKQIQQKPEYKYLYNQTYNPDGVNKTSWLGKTFSLNWVDYVEYNGSIYTADQFNSMFGGSAWGVGVTNGWIEYTPKNAWELQGAAIDWRNWNKNWAYGGQCGKFVNDYLQSMGLDRLYWNSVASKLKTINTDKGDFANLAVWSVAVFDYSSTPWVSDNAKKYGHVWIVTEVDPTWRRVRILESNLKWDEKVSSRWVTIDGNTLKGFFDPSKWSVSADNWANLVNNSTLSSVDLAKKANYLEEAKRGRLWVADTKAIGDLAAEQWWWNEWRDALNQGLKVNLTDTQTKMMNTTDSTFSSNAIVKEFESAINQMQQLQVALNDTSWVWDMSAIFTFMKTLDPSSVVRESEFNSAAATAWVLNPSAIWQKLEKNINWQFLTAEQREDFKQIAKEFIKVKAQNYQTKYDDLLKRYEYYGIDKNLAPTNMAEMVLTQLWMTPTYTASSPYNIQNTSFYQTYANTWAWNTITLSNWMRITW